MLAERIGHLDDFVRESGGSNRGYAPMDLDATNAQHAIIAVKKVILHANVVLKRKIIILQDLHSPSINHNHHYITNIRRQGNQKVLMAHLSHVGLTITISVLQNTGMRPHHCSIWDLLHSICIHLQQGPPWGQPPPP